MDPRLENTGRREVRRADEALDTADQDIVRSANVLSDFQRTMDEFRRIYHKNGFGNGLKEIMMQPARKAS